MPFVPHAVDDSGALYGTHTSGHDDPAVLSRFGFKTLRPDPEALVRTEGFDFRGSLVLDRAGARVLGVQVHIPRSSRRSGTTQS